MLVVQNGNWTLSQLVQLQRLIWSEISNWVRFPGLVCSITCWRHGFAPLFLFNFPTTCFIYFQTDYSDCSDYKKKEKQTGKAITPRISGTGAQGYSSSYLDAVSVLQWSDFFGSCFHYLKRAEKTQHSCDLTNANSRHRCSPPTNAHPTVLQYNHPLHHT